MSIVTKTGDYGTTALMFNRRVSKCDARVEAYGTVDELNAALGLARASVPDAVLSEQLQSIQQDLILLMGELATAPEDLPRLAQSGLRQTSPTMTARLDGWVREVEAKQISFSGWALPGGNLPGAALDLARTVCRRAERRVCALHEAKQLANPEAIVYLNRLSDLLWLFARQSESGATPKAE